jgi:phytoene synthase
MNALHVTTWEYNLLALASDVRAITAAPAGLDVDPTLLENAYAHCEALTAEHSRSFSLASRWMSGDKRRAVRALYAFCRTTDDLVDHAQGDAAGALVAWRERALSPEPTLDDPVALAWADARLRYHIPLHFAEQLIDGVTRDLRQSRYDTFAELAAYSYGVASTVGLMSMHIIGFAGSAALPYAIKLGVALQITNILRDVAEDWDAGRVYLPHEDLAAFNLTDDDLARGQVDDRWRAFMQMQIARNRRLYAEAEPGIALLNHDGRFAVAAASGLYRAILRDIETHDYDVFSRRAHVGTLGKLVRLPGIWQRSR